MKCKIINCENEDSHGRFVGDLCAPCYEFLSTGKGVHSQAYRNKRLAGRLLLQLHAIKERYNKTEENDAGDS